MTKFDQLYQDLLRNIMETGIAEHNERTGHETKALPGVSFSTDIERDGLPILTLRKIPVKSFIAEQIWFISGAKRPDEFLNKHTQIWNDFMETDGTIAAAYGYRWRHHFGRDQLGQLIAHLKAEPHSRQGVIITWDPAEDGLYGDGLTATYKKNAPCPFAFTVNIIGGRLHMMNIVRSNDAILGLPFDVAGFSILQCILAQKLGVTPGIYTHVIANAHVYDNHYEAAKEIVARDHDHTPIILHLPENSFERAEKKDDALLEEIQNDIASQYQPLESIKGLKIVL